MLEIISFTLGPVETNSYLVADLDSKDAVVIDPAADGHILVQAAADRNWTIRKIWLTHAHFDHIAGTGDIRKLLTPSPEVALHNADKLLWQMQGGAPLFGMRIDPGPEPEISLDVNQRLSLGAQQFEVRHAPGHTPGHVVFYCSQEKVVFCGDVIFFQSIGRTDLPGGSYNTLIDSIRRQILSLPDDTRLLSGHGPESTVGHERRWNPFLR